MGWGEGWDPCPGRGGKPEGGHFRVIFYTGEGGTGAKPEEEKATKEHQQGTTIYTANTLGVISKGKKEMICGTFFERRGKRTCQK